MRSQSTRIGRRVQIKLRVCETGSLSGVFDVWIDVELDAAKGLADIVNAAIGQAEKLPPVSAWPTSRTRR
jgi:hypothetical protein